MPKNNEDKSPTPKEDSEKKEAVFIQVDTEKTAKENLK